LANGTEVFVQCKQFSQYAEKLFQKESPRVNKQTAVRLTLLTVFIACIWAFQHYGLSNYLTLDWIKSNQAAFQQQYAANPTLVIGAFFLFYVLVTAVSLPGAGILTLAAGALFGLAVGTAVVSVASSLGATLAFLMSRFLFRDWIRTRFASTLKKVDAGIRKEGAFYLFTLRLIPVVPFFVINLVMGLTEMRTSAFFLVSQVGMLLGTVVYVNAGTELAKISTLKGILSPSLLLSFVFLGVLPLVTKKLVEALRARKTMARFQRPRRFDYNIAVLGAGSAGLVSAYIAAAVRAKVALVEKHRMGGDCLNTGCVPSKALIRSAKVLADAKRASSLGFKKIEAQFDFADVMDRVHRVIQKIEPHDSVDRYSKLGVHCISGEARIEDPYTLSVNGKRITARNIIVATGARPLVPPIPGLELANYVTSDTLWSLRELPKRLCVLGGGPIGSELAQCFARFGSKVTQVEKADRILGREDRSVSELMASVFRSEGIDIRTSHSAKRIVKEDGTTRLICDTANGETSIEFDVLLLALGRKANTTGFGLEELGVALSERGTIGSDEFLRTNFPNIFVCGDVAGPYQFTHTAAHQAWFAAVNSLFGPYKMFKADYRVIPWATFTDPEIARVGLNETDAKATGIDYEVTHYGIDDLDRAIAEEADHGFVQVITEKHKDRILGATIVGAHASDYIVEFITAMKYGIGLNKILGTIHIYPTFGEANKYAAGVWKKAHAPLGVLKRLEKYHAWRRGETFLPF
jgi:pyruvate/2-oxoglutarate dehydrogenase complex dihydrolipoamide dehydrogenase (E3) component/uncharacterized membrane protein YdjX (TVP38/TMEM64 family)